ncbi:MAG: GGDEF domain-containing protein [Acidobacteriia bacterium]|nr:GGDEF domain-containing protein [Terriglobia bacterium]
MTTSDETLSALHTAVDCYLSSLLAMANCAGDACPEIGGLYRHRLTRLRSRLAFDSSPDALEEGTRAVEAELKEYASKASGYVAQHGLELKAAVAALEEIVHTLAQRQDFYGARLRQFAMQMETTAYPAEPEHLTEVVALQVAGLMSCVESMAHEAHSLMTRMHNELAAVEQRLKEAEVTDPITGLMNRREMERQIESRKSAGDTPVLLHFHFSGEMNDELARQVGARLASQFRHKDFISRWTDTEFMVLFQGPVEIAQMRADQIVPWVAGRYLLDNGDAAQIGVEVRLTQPELVA